jgi:hypothetical protein
MAEASSLALKEKELTCVALRGLVQNLQGALRDERQARRTPSTDASTDDVMRQVAAEGGFQNDVTTYTDILIDRAYIKANQSNTYTNRFRLAGAKLTIDGSPQGFTAWRDRPYFKPVGNYPPGYSGYAAASAEQVIGAVQ